MNNLKMFCITLDPKHYTIIKQIGYTPVGLGEGSFDKNWMTDKSGKSISNKNKYYGEYTYHYWLWKNYIDKIDSEWIGFCQYRKFWSLEYYKNEDVNLDSLINQVLKSVPDKFNKYETILGAQYFVNQMKFMKFLKKGFKLILKKPILLIDKNKRNINFHFNLMHGESNLENAINLLDDSNRDDFRKFVNKEVSINPHNMFICRSKDKLKSYYEVLFPWLEKCEKLFGFKDLKGYGQIRIYGFLAERFMSYWFQKNTKYTTIPIIFHDIKNDIS